MTPTPRVLVQWGRQWMRASAALVAIPALLLGQSLGARVDGVRDGTVRFSFSARDGVCTSHGGGWSTVSSVSRTRQSSEVETDCERAPVRIAIERKAGRTTALRSYVATRWTSGFAGTDLGVVGALDAGRYLLDLAAVGDGAISNSALSAAMIADSTDAVPTLLTIAKDASRPREVRRSATFWIAQAAGDRAVGILDDMARDDPDLEVRKQAVFALSQRPADEGVPALIKIATSNRESAVRKQAFFWLGQINDPRALAFLEQILRAP